MIKQMWKMQIFIRIVSFSCSQSTKYDGTVVLLTFKISWVPDGLDRLFIFLPVHEGRVHEEDFVFWCGGFLRVVQASTAVAVHIAAVHLHRGIRVWTRTGRFWKQRHDEVYFSKWFIFLRKPWAYLRWKLQDSLLVPLKRIACGSWIYSLEDNTMRFITHLYVCMLFSVKDRESDTHPCTACPDGRVLSAVFYSTDRWWAGCSCEWQKCEAPSPAPVPSSPSRWAVRSMRGHACLAPEGGADEWVEKKHKNKPVRLFITKLR